MKMQAEYSANPESLTNRVYHKLRRDILTGAIAGGTRLVESSLAADLDVSRTPIREALHKLALEGLLYSIPRAGYIVEEMSDHDIQDMFHTRMAIEQLAADWAVDKITEAELEQLEANIKMTDEVIKRGWTEKMVTLDQEFHAIIYKACRSKSMIRICDNLSDYTLKYRLALSGTTTLTRKIRDHHQNIFMALLAKDRQRLQSALHDHLKEAQSLIYQELDQLRALG